MLKQTSPFFTAGLALMALSQSVFASTYKIDYHFVMNDGPPLKGTVVSEAGLPTNITSKTMFLRLLSTKQGKGLVKIRAEFWEKETPTKKNKLVSATVFTRLNQTAKISAEAQEGAPSYALTVKATE